MGREKETFEETFSRKRQWNGSHALLNWGVYHFLGYLSQATFSFSVVCLYLLFLCCLLSYQRRSLSLCVSSPFVLCIFCLSVCSLFPFFLTLFSCVLFAFLGLSFYISLSLSCFNHRMTKWMGEEGLTAETLVYFRLPPVTNKKLVIEDTSRCLTCFTAFVSTLTVHKKYLKNTGWVFCLPCDLRLVVFHKRLWCGNNISSQNKFCHSCLSCEVVTFDGSHVR